MTLVLSIDAIVIGLLLGSAFFKGFERTLPLIAFLLMLFPFESQIRLPGLFDLTTQRVIIILLIVLYAFSGEVRNKRKLPLKYLVLFLMVWMIVATINSPVFTISLKSVLSQFFDFFVVYYIFSKSISKAETVQKIVFAFVAAMFVCSVFGFLEIYRDWSVGSLFPQVFHRFANIDAVTDRGIRVQTTFGHAILFGAALAMAIPMALYLVSIAKTAAQKVFLWAAMMLMFLNLYKTMSRGPWLAAILSLAVTLLCGGKQMRRYVVWIALLAVTTLIVRPGVWDSIANLYGETLSPNTVQGVSYQWRYALYDQAFLHLNHNLGRALWGYGPESFYYLGWKGEFQGDIVPFESCDSSVAALMIETGYVGFLLVALLFLNAGITAFRNSRKMQRPASLLCTVLFVNICAFWFLMTNVASFGWGQQSYMIWIIFAISMIYRQLVEAESVPEEETALGAIESTGRLAGALR